MRVRQAGVFEPAGKTQSMHQSKQESHDPWCAGGDAHKMTVFVQCCGYSLALSHARSGDVAMMSQCYRRFLDRVCRSERNGPRCAETCVRDGKVEAVFEEAK